MKIVKLATAVLMATGVCVVIGMLYAYPTKWVINYLFPPASISAVFGVPAIGFWQAFWLNFLCSGLFRSNSSGGSK